MASPRYAPAGLLVLAPSGAVMLDGGLGAVPDSAIADLSAWLVTDIKAELIADIRRSAGRFGLRPEVFADAAGWSRPIRFRGGVGGHASALDTAMTAGESGVRRLVFAHIGRPRIRALDAGEGPPFGEIGREGFDYEL